MGHLMEHYPGASRSLDDDGSRRRAVLPPYLTIEMVDDDESHRSFAEMGDKCACQALCLGVGQVGVGKQIHGSVLAGSPHSILNDAVVEAADGKPIIGNGWASVDEVVEGNGSHRECCQRGDRDDETSTPRSRGHGFKGLLLEIPAFEH